MVVVVSLFQQLFPLHMHHLIISNLMNYRHHHHCYDDDFERCA